MQIKISPKKLTLRRSWSFQELPLLRPHLIQLGSSLFLRLLSCHLDSLLQNQNRKCETSYRWERIKTNSFIEPLWFIRYLRLIKLKIIHTSWVSLLYCFYENKIIINSVLNKSREIYLRETFLTLWPAAIGRSVFDRPSTSLAVL